MAFDITACLIDKNRPIHFGGAHDMHAWTLRIFGTARRIAFAVIKALAPMSLLSLDGCSFRQFWVLQPRGPVARVSF